MPYRTPISDYQFLLDHVVGFDQVAATDKFADASGDVVNAILTEAGKMCEEVMAPLQRPGDLDRRDEHLRGLPRCVGGR